MSTKIISLIGMLLLALTTTFQPAAARDDSRFVTRQGDDLILHGREFRFAGTNNYYLMYKSQLMVDDVLNAAAANKFDVVRTWGWLDIGNQDGSNSLRGKADGVYFQYWDGTRPAYNDGEDGLRRLDYIIYKAGQLRLKLVIPFTNNWNDFGGMDQYVRWRESSSAESRTWYHDDFYTDPVIRGWYKDWIAHLLNRTNSYTGVQYKHDPTIMTWELANEPRCISAGAYGRSPSCTTTTLTTWADEMSTFIKTIDRNHLVSVGDEGFYCIPDATNWIDNCGEGVDTIGLTQLPNIDVMSFHLYPDHWGQTTEWSTEYITRHIRDAKRLNKPAMLGEFGSLNKQTRNVVYKEWTDTVLREGGNGALYWILSGIQDNGTLYPDYDNFTVYAHDPVFRTLGNFAKMMRENHPPDFRPVADHDNVTTTFETPIALSPAANDISYGRATLDLRSIDLDPSVERRQTSRTVAGGSFVLQPDATVLFTPVAGFTGQAQISYTIKDSRDQRSNVANLIVNVLPDPGGALKLFSFETGTEGWASASWEAGRATPSQSADYVTDGSYGLKVDVNAGGWFGVTFTPPADFGGRTHLKFDIQAGVPGTSTDVAVQTGDSYTWRQYPSTWVNGGTATTIDIDLLSTGAAPGDFARVQTIFIYLQPGIHYLDNVRVE
ncbi:MAG TPA: cellulase family glycosylhydrolase [Herpetosiphonaceae bacterium]